MIINKSELPVFSVILERRSTRKFQIDKVSDEVIQILLESAMAAPSACNKRPWEFYVIKNEELISKLKKASKYTDYDSPLIIVVGADTKRSLANRPNDFWIQDCSGAIENILLSATELGLGTCWCGLFPMITPVKRVRTILQLNENIIPLGLIHIGYKAEEKEPRTQYEEKRVHIYK